MNLVTWYRVIRLGWHNYWRNRGLSLSATLILTLTLVVVLIFLFVNGVLSATSREMRSRFDMIITFHDSASQEQIDTLQRVLAARPGTQEVRFVSKEEAGERFKNFPFLTEKTKEALTEANNPLPRSLEVKASDPTELDALKALLAESPWKEMIRSNSYRVNQELIKKLANFDRALTTAGIVASIVFLTISLVVVMNTIRLTIFARREEIEIMRLVGANNIFIRLPFVVEAIIYGVTAAFLAIGATWLVIQKIGPPLNNYLDVIELDLKSVFIDRLPLLIGLELIIGLSVAIFGSLVSIQRYLKH